MTFPVVKSTATFTDAAGTSHAVTLPAGIVAGDLLVVFINVRSTSITLPTGWTQVYNAAYNGLDCAACFTHHATGAEGPTVTITTGSSKSVAIAYCISGWSGTPTVSTVAGATSTAPNSASLTSGFGAVDTLWLSVAHLEGVVTITSIPTNYTGGLSKQTSTTNGASIGTAQRNLNAASEDPGAYVTPSAPWNAYTVAIRTGDVAEVLNQATATLTSNAVTELVTVLEALSQATAALTSYAMVDTSDVAEALDQATATLTSYAITELVTVLEALSQATAALTSYDVTELVQVLEALNQATVTLTSYAVGENINVLEALAQATAALTSYNVTDLVTITEALAQATAALTSYAVGENINVFEALDQATAALTAYAMGDSVTITIVEALNQAIAALTSYALKDKVFDPATVAQHNPAPKPVRSPPAFADARTAAATLGRTREAVDALNAVRTSAAALLKRHPRGSE